MIDFDIYEVLSVNKSKVRQNIMYVKLLVKHDIDSDDNSIKQFVSF
jgi:hypothetical protein